MKKILKKKSDTCEEGGANLRISVWHLLMNLKNNYLLKYGWSGPIKNVKILIFSMLDFFFSKKRKTPGDIIILHLCTKDLDDIIYSSWDIERDRLKLVILGHFFSFYPPLLKTQKIKILKKWKKFQEISLCTSVPKTTIIWGTVPEIWSKTDLIFLSFWAIFCPFTPLTARRYHHFTQVPKIMIICYTVPKMWHLTDVIVIYL